MFNSPNTSPTSSSSTPSSVSTDATSSSIHSPIYSKFTLLDRMAADESAQQTEQARIKALEKSEPILMCVQYSILKTETE